MNLPPDFLRTAIRVYPTRTADQRPKRARRSKRAGPVGAPNRAIVFDCETTVDTTQQLNFGAWRYYIDGHDTIPGTCCVEEGIFFADDLPDRDPDGYRLFCDYARTHEADVAPGHSTRLRLLTRKQFVEQVLYKRGYKLQADIVGFNLPFDLTRLATHAAPARGRNRGGISLQLWNYRGGEHPFRPRIVIRTIGGRRALIHFTSVKDGTTRRRGRFVDLATLAFAHSDEHDRLVGACKRFGAGYTKREVTHGEISGDYVGYCREDVEATAGLYQALMVEHARHPIDLPAHWALSAASIGKAYWRAMCITPFAERTAPPDPTTAGYAMAAFYGGRSECRIRNVDTPVVYVDFLSMYVTCNALMNTWPLIIHQHTSTVDITDQVRQLVADRKLRDRCFDAELWPLLHTLVEIDPNGAILPVRAKYTANGSWGTGVNPLHTDRSCWYALGDVLAAVLLGGPTPIIKRALRLVPTGGLQEDLRPVALRGEIDIDPARNDFFKAVVEQRHRVRSDTTLPEVEQERLQRFLKVLGNSTAYGILVQYDRQPQPDPIDITAYGDTDPFTATTDNPEDPGDYTHPAIAACVTAAARLMLALLEHEVTRHGGHYVFCDTDSMAIVATPTGGTLQVGDESITALDWATVDRIVDQFETLNPYDRTVIDRSILKVEDENRDAEAQQELRCFAISAKRYQLTTTIGENVKVSEHGLGQLMNPRDDGGDWYADAWRHLRDPSLEPDWLDLPALYRITVTSPHTLRWFQDVNHGRTYSEWVKPGNLVLLAQPDPLAPGDIKPVTAYDNRPSVWRNWTWLDRTSGQPINVHVTPLDGCERPGCRVLTYRDILSAYRRHPEAKSLAPNGEPCPGDTIGLLRRRPVHAVEPVTYIGKEAHELDNRAVGITGSDDCIEYRPTERQGWHLLVVPVLATIRARRIAEATGVNLRTVQRARNGSRTPRARDRELLHRFAVEHARAAVGASRTADDEGVLYQFVSARGDA